MIVLRFVFLTFLFTFLFVPMRATAQASPSAEEAQAGNDYSSFDDALNRAYETGDFVGLAVAVVKNDKIVYLKTLGVTDIDDGQPVTPHSVFRIASLSKGFAATLAGLAFEEKNLSMDARVTDFAPAFQLKGGAETALSLAHILSHRTGLPPNAYDNLLEADQTPAKILPQYKKVKLICPVAACYAYQNIAFDLIHRVLSAIYESGYDELVAERLFVPLEMETASIGRTALLESGDWAKPHRRKRNRQDRSLFEPWRKVEVKDAYYRVPAAGGVNASILDMAKWAAAQMGANENIVPNSVLQTIHTPRISTLSETRRLRRVTPRYRSSRYGFGWRIYRYGDADENAVDVIAHSGGVDGYGAQIALLKDKKTAIVILSNARSTRLWRILPTFLDLELGLTSEDWLQLSDQE